MLFDLSNKLAWMLISDVLWNMKNKFVFVSLDDILIIFPEPKGTHSPILRRSGETYSSSNYKNNKKQWSIKCEFCTTFINVQHPEADRAKIKSMEMGYKFISLCLTNRCKIYMECVLSRAFFIIFLSLCCDYIGFLADTGLDQDPQPHPQSSTSSVLPQLWQPLSSSYDLQLNRAHWDPRFALPQVSTFLFMATTGDSFLRSKPTHLFPPLGVVPGMFHHKKTPENTQAML